MDRSVCAATQQERHHVRLRFPGGPLQDHGFRALHETQNSPATTLNTRRAPPEANSAHPNRNTAATNQIGGTTRSFSIHLKISLGKTPGKLAQRGAGLCTEIRDATGHNDQPNLQVYLRLVVQTTPQQWDGRGHFFVAAAEAMRRILIDRARAKGSRKRRGRRLSLNFQNTGLSLRMSL
ncbi:MAG: hypothetical protein CMJ80_10115 [Planctomycetaceae bacterium]|nr:hypothetical protein [Planctomycetaceae bacterium]